MIDLIKAENVEILIVDSKIWINVDGICKLRIGKVDHITIDTTNNKAAISDY